jgi:hypothetical protein
LFDEFVIKLPSKVVKHNVSTEGTPATHYELKLDYFGRHMAVLNDAVWSCRLPWREYFAMPSTAPLESDEPGNPEVFDRIELSNDSPGVPVLGEFYGDGAMMIAAKGRNLYTIDFDKNEVVAQTDVGNPIVHLDVAFETGDAIIVDSVGKLYLLNHQLNQIVSVGECDLDLPMPVISPESARIAMYASAERGRVYKIEDLVVLDQFDVRLENAGEPLAMQSGRVYDLWVEKNAIHKRPNYPNDPGADRKTFRASVYWDIQRLIDRHSLPIGHTQFVIAKRSVKDANGDSQEQQVAFDASLGERQFFAPLPLPELVDKHLAASGRGTRICIGSGDQVQCYFRILDYTKGVSGLHQFGRQFVWDTKFEELEKAAALISALPENRHDRRPQQAYGSLVSGVSGAWLNADYRKDVKDKNQVSAEQRQQAKEVLEELEAWAKKKSTLAVNCQMEFHSKKAWYARGGGYSSTVTREGWAIFEEQNDLAMALWSELKARDDIPASAFAMFVKLARDTGLEYDDVSEELSRAVHLYPIEDDFHHQMMIWLLEKWGGNRGSCAAYAAAVADAVGPGRGDFLYSRLVQRIAYNYSSGFFRYAQVDARRVLRGIRYGIQTGYWQSESALDSLFLLTSSIRGPGSSGDQTYKRQVETLSSELAEYYRERYPMLLTMWTKSSLLPLFDDYLAK